ncbi:MAG: LysM peptidoglycan-binding domain-containing protein [Gammaproteobacteria bacterium]|nr:MAG: LysM peptidoglycan-binding domain-containing protein [Gammaproteobacteria bacterium]
MPVAVAAPVGATYAPIVPTVAPEASAPAPVASAPAPAAATAATDASAPAPMDASVSGLPSAPASPAPASPAAADAAPTQLAGLAPDQYGDLFDRMRAGFKYDGRRDIVESTRAALDYLQRLHDEFEGDWLLAVAAYNCGEAMVERAVDMNRAAHRPVTFWDLWLPGETRAYVPKLLAMKRLVRDPETYGLEFSPIPNSPYFARIATHGQVNLKIAAEIAGVSPEELYELNPAFHRWATDPAGPHYLLLPVDAADVFSENLEQLSADQRLGVNHYSVRRGDSIASVARKFHTSVNVIRELNDLTGGLTVGDDLRVPSAVSELPAKVMLAAARVDGYGRSLRRAHVQVVRRGDSLWTIARRNGMNVNTLASLNGMHPGDTLRAGQHIRLTSGSSGGSGRSGGHRRLFYTVREGDTVTQIARLFQCSVPQLLAWNGLSSGSRLHAGQKLRIRLHTRHH